MFGETLGLPRRGRLQGHRAESVVRWSRDWKPRCKLACLSLSEYLSKHFRLRKHYGLRVEDVDTMAPLLPGAEPFDHVGGPVGVLLCHGFTGSPQTLRGWADYLAGQDLTVSLPRLPGHGTTWQDLAKTGSDDWYAEVDAAFGRLASRCEQTFVFGLSMGGCLALRLAETHGSAVRGLVLVNPSLAPDTRLFLLAPVLKYVVRSLPGIASDIKKPGAEE